VHFFLEGIARVAHNAVQSAQRLVSLFKNDSMRLHMLGGAYGNVNELTISTLGPLLRHQVPSEVGQLRLLL
jgi:hypothetical protein